jgi:peptide/nickel transport system substrate-binding protein
MKFYIQKIRIVTWAILAGCIIYGMTGCGSGKTESEPSTLRVGIGTDVDTWHCRQFPGGDSRYVWSQVYETLVRLSPDLKLQPGLAVSWTQSSGGRVWEFELRRNVRFHDGSALTAQSVLSSYSPESYSRRTVLRPVDKIEAVGKYTVRFHLKRPMPLPYYLTHVAWPIMSPNSVDEEGKFQKPVGTGPYRFHRQVRDERIVLRSFHQYWGDRPTIDRVVFEVLPSASARVMALEGGELDMIVKVQECDVPRLEKLHDFSVHRTLSTFTDFLQFNCLRLPLSEQAVRQAIAYAVDTEKITNTVLENVGQPAYGRPYSPIMFYSDPELKLFSPDPERARKLLTDAGWQDNDEDGIRERSGEELTLVLLVSQNTNVASSGRFFIMAEVIQQNLRQIGIDVDIRQLESGAFLRAECRGDFDMLLRTGFYVWGPYPRHFFLHSSQNPYSHCRIPELDALIRDADAAETEKERGRLYNQLQREVMEQLPAFYLVHQEKVVATGPRVEGYQITAEPPRLNLQGISTQ